MGRIVVYTSVTFDGVAFPPAHADGDRRGTYARLRLVDSTVSTTGVVIATYEPAT